MKKTPLDLWIKEKYKIDTGSRESIGQWQLEKFNQLIERAREDSVYYKKSLMDVPVLKTWKDIEKLPFTDGHLLCANGAEMLCVPQGEISRVVTLTTSGTTGKPKRLLFTEEDQELTVDFFRHGMKTLAFPGERALIGLPCKMPGSVGDLLIRALLREGVQAIPYGLIENLKEVSELIEKEKPEIVVGVPVQILALSLYGRKKRASVSIKRVLLSTDHASKSMIGQIEKNWDCRVFNHYGMTETGLGGAVECEAHEGMHIRENDLLFEVIDMKTGRVLPEGEEGELVFTTLTRTGMPLIRYRTGDRGRLIDKCCSCKSRLRRLFVSDRIRSGNWGGYSIQQLDEELFSVEGVVDYRGQHLENRLYVYCLDRERERIETQVRMLPFVRKNSEIMIEIIEVQDVILPFKGKRRI